MPFITGTIAAIGAASVATGITTAAAVGGLALSAKSYVDQKDAQKDASEASQRAEGIRKEQARVEELRAQRKIFQDAMRARAYAASTAATQGGLNSSGYEGAIDTALGAQGAQTSALSQNVLLGSQMFDANAALAEAKGEVATAQGLGDIGKSLFQSSDKIGAIGSTLYNKVTN